MPNIKSAKKRVKVIKVKTLNNTNQKSALKTAIKKCKEAITKNDAVGSDIFKKAIKAIDKAAAKNLLHKNAASRKKSQLAKAFNAMTANS